MRLTIKNEALTLSVETLGAQMMNLCAADGTEYLWQGDAQYWPDRSPVLFPVIARLTNNSYCFRNQVYRMGIHGFAAQSQFVPVEQTDTKLVLALDSQPETLRQYPFRFRLEITYALQGQTVAVTYHVQNHSEETMPFGIGGHPGFRVPLEPGERFEDYALTFGCPCQPDRVGFTPTLYLSGNDIPFELEQNQTLPLNHRLFDDDAIILKNMARCVTLHSCASKRSVTVSCPDMPYLGFWHVPQTDAPYVCIEPWSSLPARQDVVEELSCKSDLIQLAAGKTYETTWTISVT